jgi:hypothetical protein
MWEFQMANTIAEESGVPSMHDGPLKWKFSSQYWYKVNWNVAIDSTNRRIGVGIIVRDYKGQVSVTRSKTLNVFKNL